MLSRIYHILFQPEIFHGSALTRPRAALAFLLLFPLLILGFIAFFLTAGIAQLTIFAIEMILFLTFFTLAALISAQEMSRLTKYLFSKEDVWTLKEPEDAQASTTTQAAASQATPVQATAPPTTSPASTDPQQPPSP